MKKVFKPILGDLSKLSEKEQQDYIVAVCDFLGVPSDLGVVGLQWMDTGDSARQLVAYVKKGATDIIRGNRKINVTSLTPLNGDGYVGFQAQGQDSTGRQEIAVGTVSIRGLSGKAQADCVMTAQTKALRRLTLQFAGGGFLDELEINEKTTALSNAAAPLSQLATPSTPINTQSGTDITPVPEPKDIERIQTTVFPPSHAAGPTDAVAEPRKRRSRKTVSLDSDASETLVPSPSEQLQAELEPLPEKAFDIGGPPNILPNDKFEIIKRSAENMGKALQDIADRVNNKVLIEMVEQLEKPFIGTKPTKDQQDEYRKRLSRLINEVLKPAGLLQSEKSGSVHNKIKLFFLKMFPKLEDVKLASVENWSYFFDWMDKKINELGVSKVVELINEKIGDNA